ncbi:zinc finger protein 184-like [Myxocyprinus asiaticus]|uniref:zinc finger protein 184-like n=1 Tax=Myxocyprinus asiaticus TaxID=70543 RepID=UPI0022234F95|nr:zinc finger protein 184-like [Myxocyprinus asiaticus]
MEVEDAFAAKFKTLVEGLMMTTTSEIVKIFSKVLLDTRVEITRSWKEIDSLKQQLKQCEQQKAEAIFRTQRLSELKEEDVEVEVSSIVSQLDTSSTNTVRPGAEGSVEGAENATVGNRGVSQGNAKASGPEMTTSSQTDASCRETQKGSATSSALKKRPNQVLSMKGRKASKFRSPSQPMSKSTANGPSTSIGTLTNNPKSVGMKTVKKRKYIKKKHVNDISAAHALRDRQRLSMQRRCLCCSSNECYFLPSPSRAHHPSVYICRKCEKRFKTHLLFKTHKCSMPQSCNSCGQMFTTVQGLAAHNREVNPSSRPLYSCNQCEQTFATQCAWSLHKRIHTNGTPAQYVHSQTFCVPKLEVRLERISDSQLKAALSTKIYSWIENPTSHTSSKHNSEESTSVNILETNKTQVSPPSVTQTLSGTLSDSSIEQSNVRKVYAVMATSSCQIQMNKDASGLTSPNEHESDKVTDDRKHSCGSDESGLCSPSRKHKMADCSHDAYNGVFPVEKILRWRNNKGRNEVRVKWMPCSLCGAKFQNTWEPAESFPGYLDDKN